MSRKDSFELEKSNKISTLKSRVQDIIDGYTEYFNICSSQLQLIENYIQEKCIDRFEYTDGMHKFKYNVWLYRDTLPEYIVDIIKENNSKRYEHIIAPYILFKQSLLAHNKFLISQKIGEKYPDIVYKLMVDETRKPQSDGIFMLHDLREYIVSTQTRIEQIPHSVKTENCQPKDDYNIGLKSILKDNMVDYVLTKVLNWFKDTITLTQDKQIHIEHSLQVLLLDINKIYQEAYNDSGMHI